MHLIPRGLLPSVLVTSLFAGIVLDYPIHWYMDWLRKKSDIKSGIDPKLMFLPRLLGKLERVMYVFVLALGFPQFIVVWLGMKTVGGVEIWNKAGLNEYKGRARYQVNLIGTLLSLAAAGASYYIFCLWARNG